MFQGLGKYVGYYFIVPIVIKGPLRGVWTWERGSSFSTHDLSGEHVS